MTGDSHDERVVVGGVPRLLGEDRLASDWVPDVDDRHLLDVVLLDDVERPNAM